MSIVKKWISCVISFIAGVCGLALSGLVGMEVVTKIDGSAIAGQLGMPAGTFDSVSEKIVKGFKVITDSSLYSQAKDLGITTEFVWLKIFAILTLIASILLIVFAVVKLLQNLNVIKSTHVAFDICGYAIVGLFLIATIGLMISSNVYASAMEESALAIEHAKALYTQALGANLPASALPMLSTLVAAAKISITASVGLYQPIILVISIITAIVTGTFAFLNKKDA